MPNVLGMDGPVTSASRMPTLKPFFCIWLAKRLVTSDLPTPPLPLTTAMTFPMWDRPLAGARKSWGAVRSPQLSPQEEQSCVQSDMIFVPSFLCD